MPVEAAAGAALPAAAAVPPLPELPAVQWLQWGVMLKLIVVAALFSYNRHQSTEKLASMAGGFLCVAYSIYVLIIS